MNAFEQAGEAMLATQEGQARLAASLAAGMRRAGMAALDWCARALSRTGIGTPHAN